MEKEIYSDGSRYITADCAAREFGRNIEYVKTLCRKGKIVARRMGTVWFVEHASMVAFVDAQQRSLEEHHRRLSEKLLAERAAAISAPMLSVTRPRSPLLIAVRNAAAAMALVLLVIGGVNTPAMRTNAPLTEKVAGLIQMMASPISALLSWGPLPWNAVNLSTSATSSTTSVIKEKNASGNSYVTNNTSNTYYTTKNSYPVYNNTYFNSSGDSNGISEQVVDSKIASSATQLRNEFGRLANVPASGGIANMVSLVQRVDRLAGATISDSNWTGGTLSNAAISGGSISGVAVAASSINVSGNSVFSTTTIGALTSSSVVFTEGTTTSFFVSALSASTSTIASLSLTNALGVSSGGTGTSTAPAYGQVLLGSAAGGYDFVATSSLGFLTSNITEGSNLYFTNSRVNDVINASSTIIRASGAVTYGKVLIGNSSGGFSIVSTSTLGLGNGGGAAVWGGITGNVSDQADLQAALDAKLSLSNWYATTTTALAEGSNLYYTDTRVNSYIAASTTIPKTFASNTWNQIQLFSGGLTAYASSTIGNGTQAGGLTISGGATTTGNASFTGGVGVGLTPGAAGSLKVSGTIIANATVASAILFAGAGAAANPSISFSANANTGLFNPTANTIAFTANGIESARLTASGFGIGTTTPWGKLAVVLGGTDTNINAFIIASSTAGTATTTLFSIDNLGNQTVLGNSTITGFTRATNNILQGTVSTGVGIGYATAGQITTYSNGLFGFTSGNINAGNDTGISRVSAGVLGFGTGAQGSAAGGFLAASSTILGNFTTTGALAVAGNTTLANATTSNMFSTTASSTNLFSTNGNIGVLSAGTLNLVSTLSVSGLSTLTGFISTASSTIGNGTQTGGLTIFGGATTTGNVALTNSTVSSSGTTGALVVTGGVGIGGQLNVTGSIGTSGNINALSGNLFTPFMFGSQSANGTLSLDSTSNTSKGKIILAPSGGSVGIGTTTPFGKFALSLNSGETYTGNNAFIIASSTASATTTLFSISNTGVATIGSSLAINGASIGVNALGVTGSIGVSGDVLSNSNIRAGTGGQIFWQSRADMTSPADGVITLQNFAQTDFARLQFGGTTSAFPSIKRNAASIDFRLADDSAYANIAAASATFSGSSVGIGTTTPWGKLAVVLVGTDTNTNAFIIASSTAGTATSTLFSISNAGNAVLNVADAGDAFDINTGATALVQLGVGGTTGLSNFNASNGQVRFSFDPNGQSFHVGQAVMNWQNSSNANGTADTGLSRISAGVLGFGTGASASTAGGFLAASSTILGNFTSTGNGIFSGNVGIGTTTPGTLLDIYGNPGAQWGTSLHIQPTTMTNQAAMRLDNTGGYMLLGRDSSAGGTLAAGSSPYFGVLSVNNSYGLQLGTSNTVRATLSASGNFGIGTTTPDALLNVTSAAGGFSSSFNVDPTSGSLLLNHAISYTNTGARNSALSQIKFGVGSSNSSNFQSYLTLSTTPSAGSLTERLRIDASGNVGIGTASPGNTLDVEAATGPSIKIAPTTGTSYGYLGFSNTGGNFNIGRESSTGGNLLTGSSAYASVLNSFGTAPMQFGVNGSLAMTILSSGYVGIGTNAPGAPLAIRGGSNTQSTILLDDTNVGGGNLWGLRNGAPAVSNGYFSIMNETAGTAPFVIDTSGNIGMGILSPHRKLDLSTSGQLTFGDDVTADSAQGIYWHGGSAYSLARTSGAWAGGDYQQLDMQFATGIIIDGGSSYGRSGTNLQPNGGRVMIGTTMGSPGGLILSGTENDPTAGNSPYLGTNGTAVYLSSKASDWTTIDYYRGNGLLVGGAGGTGDLIYYGTLTNGSDQRIKANIQSLDATSGLAAIERLRPVEYNWLSTTQSTTTQLGLIAQEVRQVFPNLVKDNGTSTVTHADGSVETITDTLGVNYVGLISPIVKAVQEIANISSSFKTNLIAWFASATNGISDFFAGTVHTKKICVAKSDGTEFCATGDQLATAVAAVGGGTSSGGAGSVSPPAVPDSPAVATSSDPVILDTGTSTPSIDASTSTLPDTSSTPPADATSTTP